MKVKLLTLLVALFLVCNISSAQGVGTFKAKKKSTIVKKNLAPQRQGFYVMPEVGIGICIPDLGCTNMSSDLQAVFGYEFNNHFAIGVGTGFDTYNVDNEGRDRSITIPIYANIHGDLLKTTTSLYYSIDIGMLMSAKKEYHIWVFDYIYMYGVEENIREDTDEIYHYHKGFYISPEFGIRINYLYIGICCDLQIIHREKYLTKIDETGCHTYYSYGRGPSCSLSLKFGYKIPLKKVRF